MTPTCQVVVAPSKDACGKPATHVVIFSGEEGGRAPVCHACGIALVQVARSYGTNVRVLKLEEIK